MPRYEFSEGSSNKFWEIELSGKSFTCRFGKIGSNGQTTIKSFPSEAAAKTAFDKLIAEKTKKGYRAVGTSAPAKSSKTVKAAPPAQVMGKTAKLAVPKTTGQYFEHTTKFWEITLDGTSFTTRFGKLGTNGQSSTKKFETAGEARAEYQALVAEKTKKGYKHVRGDAPEAPEPTHARDAKLEAAIEADPDDREAYLVYGDWLQGHGDVRGELIALQAAGKTAPANKLIAQNREHFYGKLADFVDILDGGKYRQGTTAWRYGYLQSLWIANSKDRDPLFDPSKPEVDVDDALAWALEHPSARFLRELTVGIVSFESNGYDATAKVIGEHPMPTLKKLYLGDFHGDETELNWSDAGNLQPLYKGVPNLESLTIRSGSLRLGKIDLPKLRELVVITGGLDKGSVASVCAARWPVLEKLSLQIGRDTDVTVKHLQPIFDAKGFAKVKHLGLGNAEIADAICEALARSKIAAQLESLDLSLGTMGDAGAAALATGSFPKLQTLDVSRNWLTKNGIAALKKVAKQVIAKDQEDDGGDPDNRYIGAYE